MQIAVITDTHMGARGDNEVFIKKQKEFFENIFFPTLKEHNIKTVLHMGDLFDRRKNINFFTLQSTKEMFLDVLRNNNIEMHIIVGNHDSFYKNTNRINSLELLLSEYKNAHVYSDNIKELQYDNCKIAMVPWLNDDNKDRIFSQLKKTNSNIVMGHFEIEGFLMNAGNVCKHGISSDIFSNFEKVYSGHFHTPSQKSNIEYIGAPYEMDWSDYGGKRGFYLLDTITKEMEFVENTYKLHYVVDYDENIEEDTKQFDNAFVKLNVRGEVNQSKLDKFIQKVYDSNVADIKTTIFIPREVVSEEDIVESSDSTITLIEKVIDEKNYSEEKAEILKNKFKHLYSVSLSGGSK